MVELALTCEDPDAPGGTFVHWVAWGIDPSSGRLGAEDGPQIGQGRNGFGPPPGHGPHRYEFTLHALGGAIDLAPGSAIEELRAAIDGRIRATATLMGTYER